MTRLNFRFIPRDAGDFDVCSGPPRPDRTAPPETPASDSAPPPATTPETAQPAKG
jgi:hypothetical protein